MKVYLISGESYLLINEQIGTIVGDSKNVTTFDLGSNTLEDVIIEAGYVSMFLETKYIIVRNANFFGSCKIKEDDNEMLLKFLDNSNFNVVMIFVINEKLDMRKKITKIIKDKHTIISVPNLKFYETENRVLNYFKKSGYEIDKISVNYIVDNALNNYDIVMSEVEKVLLYHDKPGFIKHNDVVNIIAKSINTNNFLLVDAVVDNDLEKSLEYLNDLKIMRIEPTVLISLLARDFRIMLNIKKMQEQNMREYGIMNELGLQDWQLEKYLKKVFPYKIKELEELLIKLSKLDLEIKSGKIDRFMGLELFIMEICE